MKILESRLDTIMAINKCMVRYSKHFGLDWSFNRIECSSKIEYALCNTVSLMLLERLQDSCSKLQDFRDQQKYIDFPQVELHQIFGSWINWPSIKKLSRLKFTEQIKTYPTSGWMLFFYDVTTLLF